MKTKEEYFVEEAFKYAGAVYIWGGHGDKLFYDGAVMNNPFGPTHPFVFDCYGLVSYCMFRTLGMDLRWSHNSKIAYNTFPETKVSECGTLKFYGKDVTKISHVAIDLGRGFVLQAAGGDQTTTTPSAAYKRNAKVMAIHENRQDLIGLRRIPLDLSELRAI